MLRFEFVYSYAPARPPRVSVITFTSYICCIYALNFGQYRTLFCIANSSISKCLLCSFCSSDRDFASDFFQTPPHDGRPCSLLTAAFPMTEYQCYIVHMARNTLKYVADKDRKDFVNDLKSIYRATDKEQWFRNMQVVAEKWDTNTLDLWIAGKTTGLRSVRCLSFRILCAGRIYTTNAIESLNGGFRGLNMSRMCSRTVKLC